MLSEEHKEIINKFVKIQGHCFRLTDASSSHDLTDRIKPRFVRLNSVDLVSDKIDGDRDDEYHRFFRRPVVRTGRNFNLATLHRVNLRFADLRWSRFRYAEISKSDLYGANLREADFTGALMGKSDLRVANAAGAIFDHAYLRKSRMTGIELQGASLNNANLDKAVLMAAKLKNAKLCRTRFKRADLTGAQLNGAIIAGTKFDHALMIGADLRGAGLGKAKECGDKQPTFAGVYLGLSDLRDPNLLSIILKTAGGQTETDPQEPGLAGSFTTDRDLIERRCEILTLLVNLACDQRGATEGVFTRWQESKNPEEQLQYELFTMLATRECSQDSRFPGKRLLSVQPEEVKNEITTVSRRNLVSRSDRVDVQNRPRCTF